MFERLVDLKLPALGDIVKGELLAPVQALAIMNALPDEPRYHESAPKYFYVLCPRFSELEDSLPDAKYIEMNFGRYYSLHPKTKLPLSVELLKRHPMYNAGPYFVLSEECFTEICPYLDLDYYYIDAVSLLPRVTFD